VIPTAVGKSQGMPIGAFDLNTAGGPEAADPRHGNSGGGGGLLEGGFARRGDACQDLVVVSTSQHGRCGAVATAAGSYRVEIPALDYVVCTAVSGK